MQSKNCSPSTTLFNFCTLQILDAEAKLQSITLQISALQSQCIASLLLNQLVWLLAAVTEQAYRERWCRLTHTPLPHTLRSHRSQTQPGNLCCVSTALYRSSGALRALQSAGLPLASSNVSTSSTLAVWTSTQTDLCHFSPPFS